MPRDDEQAHEWREISKHEFPLVHEPRVTKVRILWCPHCGALHAEEWIGHGIRKAPTIRRTFRYPAYQEGRPTRDRLGCLEARLLSVDG